MTDPNDPGRSRTSQGRFARANAEVEHDARAAELRGQGKSYRAIARELGVSVSSAHDAVMRAFRDTLSEPAEQARAVELARLEEAHDAALAVLLREHLTVSHGKIIVGNDGRPLIDDGPTLQAIDRIRALSESRRKLLGLDAPQRHELTMEAIDAALAEADAELAAAHSEAGEAEGTAGEAR